MAAGLARTSGTSQGHAHQGDSRPFAQRTPLNVHLARIRVVLHAPMGPWPAQGAGREHPFTNNSRRSRRYPYGGWGGGGARYARYACDLRVKRRQICALTTCVDDDVSCRSGSCHVTTLFGVCDSFGDGFRCRSGACAAPIDCLWTDRGCQPDRRRGARALRVAESGRTYMRRSTRVDMSTGLLGSKKRLLETSLRDVSVQSYFSTISVPHGVQGAGLLRGDGGGSGACHHPIRAERLDQSPPPLWCCRLPAPHVLRLRAPPEAAARKHLLVLHAGPGPRPRRLWHSQR